MWFDSNLSMHEQITRVSSTAFYICNVRRIHKYLSQQSTETLIHAFISSRLDYCNSLQYGSSSYQIKKLQHVQNAAARVIFQEAKYYHVTTLLGELQCLHVKFCIDFKILLITFKVIHRQTPHYLSELITIKQKGKYSLRSTSSLTLNYCSIKLLTMNGDRFF